MRVPLKWLEQFVAIDVPVEKLVELLDLSGTKVESARRPSGATRGVVVAEVLEISEHPNADNLTLVDVRTDFGETQRVVCGARNFAAGDLVPLAQVGAQLPEMEITERKIRGETSRGMLCSAAELGVSSDHSGILVLPTDAPLGADVVSLLGLDDTVLELEITPNRPDCMSIYGMAREVSAILGNELKEPEVGVETVANLKSPVKVDVEDSVGCPRYLARYIENVRIAPSPAWLAARLLGVGVRPISNVVDVTNYVLFELGQPLHAFDAAKVKDQHIVVRRARRGERIVTLDGQERALHADDLLIAQRKEALAIAGVMGGGDSEVSADTRSVILESAHFDRVSISFTSRRHGLRTEASARFERGTDPELVESAAARAAGLISEIAEGHVAPEAVDVYPVPARRPLIRLRTQRAGQVLGAAVAPELQAGYLRALGLGVAEGDGGFDVTIPTFRPDLTREIDLVEEVGRLAGFERLPATVPPGRVGALTGEQRAERTVRTMLTHFGLFEAWTSSFISDADLERLGVPNEGAIGKMVRIANPMSQDETSLRTTLLPGLLRAVALNERQRAVGTALFELARVYEPSDGPLPTEALILSVVLSGARSVAGWSAPERPWTFFDGKGIVEALFDAAGLERPSFSAVQGQPFHPTRAAAITFRDGTAGAVGELHPQILSKWGIERPVVALELALAPLVAALPPKPKIEDLSRFPSNYLDIAIVVDAGVAAASVATVIRKAGGAELAELRLFDTYQGDQVASGKKSLAFALELRAHDRTLSDPDAAAVRERILAAVRDDLGAELRS